MNCRRTQIRQVIRADKTGWEQRRAGIDAAIKAAGNVVDPATVLAGGFGEAFSRNN